MAPQCEICHARSTKANPVIALAEVVHGDETAGPKLELCRSCIQRREVRSWASHGKMGRAILQGLAGHPQGYSDRYTYFEDAQNVHLLRLRAQWAHRHEDGDRREEAWSENRQDFSVA